MVKTIELKEFKINNLFESQDVHLKFDNKVNIYIGENGLGKTTILNIIFYTLTSQFEELYKLSFDSIEITFSNNKLYSFNHNDIQQYKFLERIKIRNREMSPNSVKYQEVIQDTIDENIIKSFIFSKKRNGITNRNTNVIKYIEELSEVLKASPNIIERELTHYINTVDFRENAIILLNEQLEKLLKKNSVLYFPTFRRIEEDISKFKNIKEDIFDDFEIDNERKEINKYGELIKFGMSDVEDTIKKLLDQIQQTSINSFNQMTGILLKQYVENKIDEQKYKNIDIRKLRISLDRVGDQIEDNYKNKIIDLVKSGETINHNIYLLNLLNNLINSYEQQESIDNKINSYVKVCNSYLVNKKYIYDASKVTLNIFNSTTGKQIPLQNLSSGEKQIVSTFSKVYLEDNNNYIILFDEPELSLSIQWQRTFLPDIISSGKCHLLISVTHSPFIFENDELFNSSKSILEEIDFIGGI